MLNTLDNIFTILTGKAFILFIYILILPMYCPNYLEAEFGNVHIIKNKFNVPVSSL